MKAILGLMLVAALAGCSPNVGTEQEIAMERCIGHGGVQEVFRNSVICKNGAGFNYPYRKDPKD